MASDPRNGPQRSVARMAFLMTDYAAVGRQIRRISHPQLIHRR
jgi:hypothetical protein